ncbi:MAG: LacI family transcriptional regulator [Thermomicrobiales bacterium]|jgi:LacI family transcriptional regulator|nr:LacI family transcriptional regulator [Thermomicrobiales bacterium]
MTAAVGQNGVRRSPTMRDVAEAAGVSPTTVSFVINDRAGVGIPDATRSRVWTAVKQLDYRPNATARHLRTRRSQTIGFVTNGLVDAPFAADLILGAQDAAWAREHLLAIATTDGDPRAEEAAMETLLSRRVDGIIFATSSHRVVTPPAGLRNLPAVLLNCVCADRSLPSVALDDVEDGRRATEVLLRKGHRRIGLIEVVRPGAQPTGSGRLEGYRQALGAFYARFDESLVHRGDGSAADGYHVVRELMRRPQPPTAIICGTDEIAMGVFDALRELRLVIPRDVAVLAFDGQGAIATSLRPALSTMALPFADMGRWAAGYLTDHLDHPMPLPAVQQTIASPFVERASV